ncbi:unnamed protein product [Ceratitis capitata]|uniref:(Mediterranean fruit fly) hypothetical protein n=1 Tax=Ceratitis capitata TaxID=7213 RepID=A0A811U574_CERCA|nr:unnamed protein product [Ceratitis capitata]
MLICSLPLIKSVKNSEIMLQLIYFDNLIEQRDQSHKRMFPYGATLLSPYLLHSQKVTKTRVRSLHLHQCKHCCDKCPATSSALQ